jgi:hypothetical protein
MISQRTGSLFDKLRGSEPVSGSIWLSIADLKFNDPVLERSRSQWPGLRRRSATARLLGLWVRITPGAWLFVCCECCVLSGRGLCDELITRPEESYPLWCVVLCDLETSLMRRPWPTGVSRAKYNQTILERNFIEYRLDYRPSCHVCLVPSVSPCKWSFQAGYYYSLPSH